MWGVVSRVSFLVLAPVFALIRSIADSPTFKFCTQCGMNVTNGVGPAWLQLLATPIDRLPKSERDRFGES